MKPQEVSWILVLLNGYIQYWQFTLNKLVREGLHEFEKIAVLIKDKQKEKSKNHMLITPDLTLDQQEQIGGYWNLATEHKLSF